jgi:hypothetical protein
MRLSPMTTITLGVFPKELLDKMKAAIEAKKMLQATIWFEASINKDWKAKLVAECIILNCDARLKAIARGVY